MPADLAARIHPWKMRMRLLFILYALICTPQFTVVFNETTEIEQNRVHCEFESGVNLYQFMAVCVGVLRDVGFESLVEAVAYQPSVLKVELLFINRIK